MGELEKRTAQAIVNIFESGKAAGDYGAVTVLAGDSGHLTYGKAQTTLASGNLYLLIKAYVESAGALYASALKEYLPALKRCEASLDNDARLRWVLQEAGADPAMQDVQDGFFDRVFWKPSADAARALGIKTPLGLAVVYDSHIHGSWRYLKGRVEEKAGKASTIGEKRWIAAYVGERKAWLASHDNRLLRRTIYRMEAFEELIAAGNWSLALPLTVRGVRIDADIIDYHPPVRVSAEGAEERLLLLKSPPMTGEDVRALEEALKRHGYVINTDGVFDENLERIVKDFQQLERLTADGIVGASTRAALGI